MELANLFAVELISWLIFNSSHGWNSLNRLVADKIDVIFIAEPDSPLKTLIQSKNW